MAITKDSASAPPATHVSRGITLANGREDQIWRIYPFTWEVPSCTGTGTYIRQD